MDMMGGNHYYQIFEDSYSRVTNGSGNSSTIKDGVGQMGQMSYDNQPGPPPGSVNMYSSNPQGGNWNAYSGSELDFPSPTTIGGVATISTAPSNYTTSRGGNSHGGEEGSYHSEYFHQMHHAQQNPSHLEVGHFQSSGFPVDNGRFLAASQGSTPSPNPDAANPNYMPSYSPSPGLLATAISEVQDVMGQDPVSTTTSNFYNPRPGGEGGSVGLGSPMGSKGYMQPPTSSTSPPLSLHSDMDDNQFDSRSNPKRKSSRAPSSTTGAGRGKRRKTAETEMDPVVKAQRDKDRRFSNNTRERIRIRDINDALCELGRVCRNLKPKGGNGTEDKPQTKLGVLNMAVDVITQLEKEVRERNLNTSSLSLRQGPQNNSYTQPLPGQVGHPYPGSPQSQSGVAQPRPSSSGGSVKSSISSAGVTV